MLRGLSVFCPRASLLRPKIPGCTRTINAEALAKKGARIKMTDCGGRLCIVASKNQGEGASDWHGNWNNAQTGQTFVIPQGY